jgi:hypothetical protein
VRWPYEPSPGRFPRRDTAIGKATEDDIASNDCSNRPHHRDSKGAEPREDGNEQKPDSNKRKQPQNDSSPKKSRVF